MRRADRLFQIVQELRGGRLVTAAGLADTLEVSERTIYRDIADLQASGVPVDGQAGVGYLMRSGYTLPPLSFTRDEIVALVAGARLIRAWGGASMAKAAEEALIKIEDVISDADRARARRIQIHAAADEMTPELRARIDKLENAIDGRVRLELRYTDVEASDTQRTVRPLGLWFWGKVWTLAAWCELRQDFRTLRVDRITGMEALPGSFRDEPGKTLQDFYKQMDCETIAAG